MFFRDVVNRDTIPLMDAMLSFTQQRHRVLAENVANIDTPGYRAKQLDPAKFQKALQEAVTGRRESGSKELQIGGTDQFEQDAVGRLEFTPTREPAENALFHDGTNARIERQMADMAENGMMHTAMTELLLGKYSGLMSAIRGRVA